MNIGSNIV